MQSPHAQSARCHRPSALCVAAALACLPLAGLAADAHRAVKAVPGDMVLLRNVSARPADRMAPPGMALIVSPSPRPEITAALGAQELSDSDYASLGATPSSTARLQSTTVGRALAGTLARGTGGNPTVAGNGVSNTVATPLGAVGNATAGIGDQVRGALAQFPLGNGH